MQKTINRDTTLFAAALSLLLLTASHQPARADDLDDAFRNAWELAKGKAPGAKVGPTNNPSATLARKFTIEDREELVSLRDGSLENVLKTVSAAAPVVDEKDYDPFTHESFVKCIKAAELKNVFLCIFSNRKAQNIAMLRASEFAEMGKNVLKNKEMFGRDALKDVTDDLNLVKGHDIPGNKLAGFWTGYQKLSPNDLPQDTLGLEYLKIERTFLSEVIAPKIARYGNDFVVVSFSMTDEKDARSGIPHESLHAQFFTDPIFKEAVYACYEALTGNPKTQPAVARAVAGLKEAGYSTIDADKELKVNELMAYTLMPGARDYLANHKDEHMRAIAPAVDELREPMLDFIRRYKAAEGRRLEPIQVKIGKSK